MHLRAGCPGMSALHRILLALAVVLALAPAAPAQEPNIPKGVVNRFYRWYMKNPLHVRDHFAAVRPLFEPELYDKLQKVFQREAKRNEALLDFDPFVNAQVLATAYRVGTPVMERGSWATVPMTVTYERGGGKKTLQVVVHRFVDRWRIFNFVYDKSFDLNRMLDELLKGP